MLFFGVILAGGVMALLAAEKMDIECLNPPAVKRRTFGRKAARRTPAAAEFAGGAALLRQQ